MTHITYKFTQNKMFLVTTSIVRYIYVTKVPHGLMSLWLIHIHSANCYMRLIDVIKKTKPLAAAAVLPGSEVSIFISAELSHWHCPNSSALVPKCLTGRSARVPKCLGSKVSWVRSVLTPLK